MNRWVGVERRQGFTIVELLIVIVVIGVLAAITIVAYNGVQGRANDVAVQSDLHNLADQFQLFYIKNGVYPVGGTDLATLSIRVSKNSYGLNVLNGTNAGKYDLLYCRISADGPDAFALIGSSKSGNLFVYQSSTGQVATFTGTQSSSSTTMCQAVGINQTIGTDRDFFYESGWESYVDS